jgi:hypothetical protein
MTNSNIVANTFFAFGSNKARRMTYKPVAIHKPGNTNLKKKVKGDEIVFLMQKP